MINYSETRGNQIPDDTTIAEIESRFPLIKNTRKISFSRGKIWLDGTVFENHRKKVSFSIVSEERGLKSIKNAKKISFRRVFENLKFEVIQSYQTQCLKIDQNV